MKMRKNFRKYILLVIGFMGLSQVFFSCYEDTSCGQNIESAMLFSNYKVFVDTSDNSRSTLRNHQNLSAFITIEKQDTIYPRASDTLSMIPLELNDTLTKYIFEKTDTVGLDTVLLQSEVSIYHTLPQAEFLDINCGFSPKYKITGGNFSGNLIDSIYIVNPIVDTDVYQTNIILFY